MPDLFKKLWVKISGAALIISTLAVFGIDFDEIKPVTEASAVEMHEEVFVDIAQLRKTVFDDKCHNWRIELSTLQEKIENYPAGQMPDWLRNRIITLQTLISQYKCD